MAKPTRNKKEKKHNKKVSKQEKVTCFERLEEKMQSPCIREASRACFHGCCLKTTPPSLGPAKPRLSTTTNTATIRQNFMSATTFSLHPNTQFTNHESLPALDCSFSNLTNAYPQYALTNQADQIRDQQYSHLSQSNHVSLDYIGHGLFSYSQQQNQPNVPCFNAMYKSVKLNSQILYGSQESEFESITRKRIMKFMNISEDDYTMVFTANHSSAFRILANTYTFRSNKNLLTVYDHENEAVRELIDGSKKKGAKVHSAEFSWPNMRIQSRKLKKMVASKTKKRNMGLFVFPLQSKMTGARYSYLWMTMARENGWHVLLDATALGAKDMEALGLSLFQPDFLICSFFKIFGENPSGFGCLFVKKTSSSVLNDSTASTGNIVSLVPAKTESLFLEQSSSIEVQDIKQKELSVSSSSFLSSEIVELDKPIDRGAECSGTGGSEIEFNGLDHADSLGLILISSRVKYLVNWLVNALMSLKHPNSENGLPLVRIYGPKIRPDRGPAVAFNVFDWKGEKIDPTLVQKLADRNNISLSCGNLRNIWFSHKNEEEREILADTKLNKEDAIMASKKRDKFDLSIRVITASLGFLTNFEDVYRLWGYVSRFLDADFVEKERWRYMALNRTTFEV